MFEEFLNKYVKDKFNINIAFMDSYISQRNVLLDMIYLYDDMQNISTDEVKINMYMNCFIVRSESKIQIECIDGLIQLLDTNISYSENTTTNSYIIEGLPPLRQICILPLLMPDKFKGFAVPNIAKKFEKALTTVDVDERRYLNLETKLKHSTEYEEFMMSKLSNIQEKIFVKQKNAYINDCAAIKNLIKERQNTLNKLYSQLHEKELALIGYEAKENEVAEYMEELIEVVQTSNNINMVDITDDSFTFSVAGFYSIWKNEYLQKTMENISALPFVRIINRVSSKGVGEKLYRLIFEKRRLKIKVIQEFSILYDTDNIIGGQTSTSDKGLPNIHIGYYDCWDESKQIIQEYLHEYRYADAVMQTANSAYTLNLCDSPVTERLADVLLNSSNYDYKLIVDSKTNEELTVKEVINRIKKGEYDEDII